MNVWYNNDVGTKIEYNLKDEDCLFALAEVLVKAPIDLEYLHSDKGVFNLNTFEWC